jgi:uncharacterized protein Yka (UPF0111/DUF47 family)
MLENDNMHEHQEGKLLIVLNLATMAYKHQTRFLQMFHNATKNGIDSIKFIKAWNRYAQDIAEHVFWKVKPLEPQAKFRQRGE